MIFKKFIALLTISCFLFSFVLSQPLAATVEITKDKKKITKVLDEFILPANVGRITDSYFVDRRSSFVVRNPNDESLHPTPGSQFLPKLTALYLWLTAFF